MNISREGAKAQSKNENAEAGMDLSQSRKEGKKKTAKIIVRADLVEDKVIIELKSVEAISDVHKKQLLTYLKLTGMRLGLLINFGQEVLKGDVKRIVNDLEE